MHGAMNESLKDCRLNSLAPEVDKPTVVVSYPIDHRLIGQVSKKPAFANSRNTLRPTAKPRHKSCWAAMANLFFNSASDASKPNITIPRQCGSFSFTTATTLSAPANLSTSRAKLARVSLAPHKPNYEKDRY